jgi:GT2 family glycosyltransferase
MEEPKINIFMLNHNEYGHTEECVESLLKIDYKNYQICILDNGFLRKI